MCESRRAERFYACGALLIVHTSRNGIGWQLADSFNYTRVK
jgi:hypothetical protein